jgi:chitin synthase
MPIMQHHQNHSASMGLLGGGVGSRPVSQLDLSRSMMAGNNGSRMSLAPSQYGMGGGGVGGENVEMHSMLPSDDAILAEIRDVLRTADLMTVTKKSVKAELERRFNVPLDAKKAYIGSATEAVISGAM